MTSNSHKSLQNNVPPHHTEEEQKRRGTHILLVAWRVLLERRRLQNKRHVEEITQSSQI